MKLPLYLSAKDSPDYGVTCLCGCGLPTDGWLYAPKHTPRARRVAK